MTREAHRFYLRYNLLTQVLPAYCMALISYGSAWGLVLLLQHKALLTGGIAVGTGLFAFIGLSRLLAWLGFLRSGVVQARTEPADSELVQLQLLLDEARQLHLPVELQVVELGAVPFIAAGGFVGNEVWASTHALRTLPPPVLRAAMLHELGHIAHGLRGCAWHDLLWVAAYPVAYLLASVPVLILAAALIHTNVWLHLEQWLRAKAEAQADRWAIAQMGQLDYARAMCSYLELFERRGTRQATRQRLRKMGLSAEDIARLLT